jgi:hypothetical protein
MEDGIEINHQPDPFWTWVEYGADAAWATHHQADARRNQQSTR